VVGGDLQSVEATVSDAHDTDPAPCPDTTPTGVSPIVAQALACEDLTEDDEGYWRIVDPAGDRSEEQRVAHAVSACMLFAAFLLGWAGRFVSDTIQNILCALWRTRARAPTLDNFCDLGAQLWWAGSASAPEHVDGAVVKVTRRSLYVVEIECIAGGQRIGGKRAIKRVGRVVAWDEAAAAWVDQGNGRRLRWVLDAP
jgi:hypothetical protein